VRDESRRRAEAFRRRAQRAGVFLDFDGSLSTIVARPELAGLVAGARDALVGLVARYPIVAIVSGRSADELAHLLDVDGITYQGLYGMEETATGITLALLPSVERAAALVPEAWVEYKGISVAVHYRAAPNPTAARAALVSALEPIAASAGLALMEGKMVLELVPADRPMKGGAVERLARERGLDAVLFAGDDVADIDAFEALDRLSDEDMLTLRVAVRGPETPAELVRRADIAVDGPGGLVEFLRILG
jgi:trehalose 6-phosphate phosphatase